jgi:DNA-binding CsgD family transcriptional regulator
MTDREALAEARNLVERFHTMIQQKITLDPDSWIAEAEASLIISFAKGIMKDRAAVSAAIAEPWSNRGEALEWAGEGKKPTEIASLMRISLETVKAHLDSARYKLRALNRPHAVAKALRAS